MTSYHAVEVGDSGILVGIGVKQHLGVGVNGDVCFDTFFVLAQELGDSLDLRFRFRKGATVRVIAGMRGCTFIWGNGETRQIQFYFHSKIKGSLLKYRHGN